MVLKNQHLVLPELSYQIVGALFDVFNELGAGLKERYYYSAVQFALEKRNLNVKTQIKIPIRFTEKNIGNQFLDFLINDIIVLELKIARRLRKCDYDQVKSYLAASRCPLGILARFDEDGVVYHRILNPNNS